MPRISRRPISPTERSRWLQRLERGEGISKIASTAGRDIRVIKRHVEIAKAEQDLSGARKDFIRGRIERHQDDLLGEIARLRGLVAEGAADDLIPSDPVMSKVHDGLLEHCRRHPVGRLLGRYSELAQDFRDARDRLRQELAQTIHQAQDVQAGSVTDILVNIILVKARASLSSGAPLPRGYDHTLERQGHLNWEGSRITGRQLEPEILSKVKELHGRLLDLADQGVVELRSHASALGQMGARVADALDSLLAAHMVPGRCRYCPV